MNHKTAIIYRQRRRAIEALEARVPPDSVATLVNITEPS